MRFLMRFLVLNEVLVQDLIEILILEQSHSDSQWEKIIFFRKGWARAMVTPAQCTRQRDVDVSVHAYRARAMFARDGRSARGSHPRDGLASAMYAPVRCTYQRDFRANAMVAPARCRCQRAFRASEMFALTRWSRQRDGRASAMVDRAHAIVAPTRMTRWSRDGCARAMFAPARWFCQRDGHASTMVVLTLARLSRACTRLSHPRDGLVRCSRQRNVRAIVLFAPARCLRQRDGRASVMVASVWWSRQCDGRASVMFAPVPWSRQCRGRASAMVVPMLVGTRRSRACDAWFACASLMVSSARWSRQHDVQVCQRDFRASAMFVPAGLSRKQWCLRQRDGRASVMVVLTLARLSQVRDGRTRVLGPRDGHDSASAM